MTCKECDKPVRAQGYCIKHYGLARKSGIINKLEFDNEAYWEWVKKELKIV